MYITDGDTCGNIVILLARERASNIYVEREGIENMCLSRNLWKIRAFQDKPVTRYNLLSLSHTHTHKLLSFNIQFDTGF